MRVGIREQLALLVLLTSLFCLAVISIATWVNNYNFVVSIKSQGLSLTASLKAAQVAADLELIQSTCSTIVTRILIQSALQRFYLGNNTDANWARATADVQSALASGGYASLLQATLYSRNETGDPGGLLNVTGIFPEPIELPYTYPNGTAVILGDPEMGYPPDLYPNITYAPTHQVDPSNSQTNLTYAFAFPDFQLNFTSTLMLGPFQINETYAIVSLTLPIINNTSNVDVLGYMTIIAEASGIVDVLNSREGLDSTGIVLLIGPNNKENRFPAGQRPISTTEAASSSIGSAKVDFVFQPTLLTGQPDRHDKYGSGFNLSAYPAALKAFSAPNQSVNNASSELSTINEQGASVAVGWARPRSNLADWLLIVEQTHAEAFGPVEHLRNILLACVFGTFGLIAFLVIPMAHYSVLPIRRLRDATEKSVQPPGYTPTTSIRSDGMDDPGYASGEEVVDEELAPSPSSHGSNKKRGILIFLKDLRRGSRRKSKAERTEDARRRVFKIPGKVQDRKHFITDELTELTGTFNEMSDELMAQYARLEERVEERTRELEISKKAAEAANESKTLFIANISHELKTPLNGILGMCSVCMGDDDLPRIKKSLQVVYKSGDLLLHLLNDLLTFTKNQIGQSLNLEEKEFGLSDIRLQIVTIFDKQVREGHINFGVNFINSDGDEFSPERLLDTPLDKLPVLGPPGTGRLKDMRLWGDQHRILQVIINLVSNSLKFTPEGGKVEVRIKCLGEIDKFSSESNSRKEDSIGRKSNSQRNSGSRQSRNRNRIGSGSNTSVHSRVPSAVQAGKQMGTALLINPMDPKIAQTHIQIQERSSTPPPANARTLMFEFVVDDTGPGIAEHLQQRVFEPFEQGDLGLSRKYGGTGLGLSICSQLATLMNGSITLDSTEGVGSTFTMRIPLKFVKERPSSTASSSICGSRPQSIAGVEDLRSGKLPGDPTSGGSNAPLAFEKDPQPRLVGLSAPFFASTPPSGSSTAGDHIEAIDRVAATRSGNNKVRVLVAEDNLVNQEVVLRMLNFEDIYDVTVAKDGQEAYEMVKASMSAGKGFNIIFMDIQMPNLDGLQSTRLIREMGYSAPIVALTAFAEESNVKDCLESGMDMFLSKPIRRPALKQVLQKFATIPEESEEASLTRKNTMENIISVKTSDTKDVSEAEIPATNGGAKHPMTNHS